MKVLIVKLSAFGDIIHALPALDDVLNRPEVDEVHWLVDRRFAFVTEVLPPEVKVHQIALKGGHPLHEVRRVVKQLRAEKFDLALDFQGLIKSSVLARLICSKVYGFDPQVIREKPASWFETSAPAHPDEINIVQQVRRVAQSPWLSDEEMDKPIVYQPPRIHKSFEAKLPVELDDLKPWVVFNLGGSFATKELPDQTWLQVGQALKEKGYAIVFCWGNAKEEAKAKQLNASGLGYVLTKRLTIPELCVFFKQSFAVIAADTGILHLAAALNTPTISFWGPTPRERNAPHGKLDFHVESNPDCGPCIQKTCDNFICMDMIQAKAIVQCITNIEHRLIEG
ncbi:lipopolysaccharide heptosyltransferase I [Ghiorsea bivora]|uniref:lipopolysaccharide heptosyltransferase I n=1 Tax=Ghiorsea bivora TaxID=1485545 RepID=UPI000571D46D|nr:lipopolysaccharide heptosyltransferase I [Ghiorsea bivora]